MGTRAAIKNAIMLLREVRATLVPVRRRQSPVRSFETKHRHRSAIGGRQQEERKKRRGDLKDTLSGMLLPASVKE